MSGIAAHARAFASPLHGDAVAAVRTLAGGRLSGTRRRIADTLTQMGQETVAQALLAFGVGKGSAWRPETGLSLLACRDGAGALAALQLAAACAGTGGAGRVAAHVEAARWLYLDGWLLPVQGRCSLSAEQGAIDLRSDLGAVTFVRSAAATWMPVDTPVGPWRVHESGGLAPRYVTVTGLRHAVEGFPWISTPPPGEQVPPAPLAERVAVINEGWRLILDKAPLFAPWVASTAAGCLLLAPSGSHDAQSGSSYDHPGLIAIEPPDSPAFCGEILVHECAHQHMLLYTMVAPLVRAGSQETQYSPIKRAHRTIDKVLSGAHAVGNMILYYHELRRAGALDAQSRQRFDVYRAWFAEDYRPALDRSESLTEAGRSFWQGVREAVDVAAQG